MAAAAAAVRVQADLVVTVKADSATANVGDTVTFRVVVTDKNKAPAPDLRVKVTLPANGSLVSTYADRGPGCTSTGANTLDCNMVYLSGDSPVGNLILQVKLTSAGAMPVTASAAFLLPDLAPADNSATFTVNAPAAPPPTVVPPAAVFCVVPKVSGLTVGQAAVRAQRAHCGLATTKKLHFSVGGQGQDRLAAPEARNAAHAERKGQGRREPRRRTR